VLHMLVRIVVMTDSLEESNVVEIERDCIEFESWIPMQDDLDIFHAEYELLQHVVHVD
ncbi:hypothetical protein Tco_0023612, partial [Tanacetum coccineum]